MVSEALDCNLTLAYKLISRLTRALKNQTEGRERTVIQVDKQTDKSLEKSNGGKREDCFKEYHTSVDLK